MAKQGRLHGILVIDKPAGWTSHDVVARVRRLLGERHVGHAGTLDPAATGVLPVAVGDATKVLEYLTEDSKTYLAEVTFGVATDSHDVDGRLVGVQDVGSLSESGVEAALAAYRGEIEQVPPMHSALKVGGRRLYDLARAGQEVERKARRVTIEELRLMAWDAPTATLCVDCSKGTYVRALARDLGVTTGFGAYLSNLVRVRSGRFTLADAWTLGELATMEIEEVWPSIAIHPDEAIAQFPALVLAGGASEAWRHGRAVKGPIGDSRPARAYDEAGTWLGVGTFDSEAVAWRPAKVVDAAA
jgi:tRNA pseudouridine55 synthase